MPPSEDASVGERIAYYRRRRGMSQVVLAGLVGRSDEWLSQIERGSRTLDRLSTIVEVAHALKIEPGRLLTRPFVATPTDTSRGLGVATDSIPQIRDAMMRYNGLSRLVGQERRTPPDLAELRRRIAIAFRYSQTEEWSKLGVLLPDLIADSYMATSAYSGDALREAYGLQALAYRVTSGMLDRVGESDLPWVAAERSLEAAERTEDPLLIAGGAWRLAVVLRHAGRIEESLEVPAAAADALRPGTERATPAYLSVYGSLVLKAAVAAATLDDKPAARDYMQEAERTALQIGEDRNDYWFAFGPTNVAIHKTWMALELGDPVDALRKAELVDDAALPPELAERRASHLIAVARAQFLRRKYDDVIETLSLVRTIAPEQLIYTGRVHEMLRQILRRERRSIRPDLRSLVDLVGVAG